MAQTKSTWIIVGLLAVIGVGGIAYLWQQGWLVNVVPETMRSESVTEPAVDAAFAQSARLTPEAGGVIRAVDPLGVAFVLRVPPGAVSEAVEVTLTPLTPQGTGVNYGVSIEPADLSFAAPVTLGVNWYLAGKLGHKNPYDAAPFAVKLAGTDASFVPIDKVVVSRNYVPILILGGGQYGVSNDGKLAKQAAANAFKTSDDRFTRLYAGLSLARQDALRPADMDILEADMAAVRNEEDPPVREVYTMLMLEEKLALARRGVPRAHAYGLLDGYLQFRCNLAESTYEDVVNAWTIAAHSGLSDIAELCKQRAEELLLKRANEVDRDPNRPLIDAVEVLQQMQLMGLDDGAGAAVAQRLSDDVSISLEKYLESLGQTPTEEDMEGRVRENRPSDDPLLKGNSTLMLEMFGLSMLPVVGINSFEGGSFRSFGERAHNDMGNLIELGRGMCDLAEELGAGGMPELQKECEKMRSKMMEEGLDQWKTEVDQYADGIDDIQKGQTPDSDWNDFSPLERFERFLER